MSVYTRVLYIFGISHNMRKFIISLLSFLSIATVSAQEENDTAKTRFLNEIVVEARNQRLGAEVSTYIPTAKQKNASQSAAELLDRMAIPQLNISPNNVITDLAGKNVDVFIDYLPASKDDLTGMRMQDVKKVEYYDFPSDPRFLGKEHVVNFIMQKYEYGGYVKASVWENTNNQGQLRLYSKLKYKRMTFDVAAGASYTNQNHNGGNSYETFRLLQQDGSIEEFNRHSAYETGSLRNRSVWPTLKATYSSGKITIQNIIGASFDHTPDNRESGYIFYSPKVYPDARFTKEAANLVNSISYSGFWNFIINDRNTITFSPRYAHSHTSTNSLYTEGDAGKYYNAAKDNSHQFKGDLTYAHSFGRNGSLNVIVRTLITTNSTSYHGTANASDNAHTYRVGPGMQYSLSRGKFYGLAGLGFNWDRQEYLSHGNNTTAPWVDFSLQYSPEVRYSVRGEFHYSKSIPSSSYRSAAVIRSTPLMSYTGNPDLVSYGSYDAGINFSFIPSNNLSFSAFASTWIVDKRYVFDYVSSPDGILRTIIQPGGGFAQWHYGLNGKVRLFDRKLQLTAQLSARSVHNGAPYDFNRTKAVFAFQANYYVGNWSLSGSYYSPQGYPDGCMVGTWMKTKSYYMLRAGWNNSSWNIQFSLINFARWNWKSTKSELFSQYYDKIEQTFSTDDHAMARLSVTYTIGFGKKVKRGDEASQQSGVNSGILK